MKYRDNMTLVPFNYESQFIKTSDYRLSKAEIYISKTGKSIAVVLYAANPCGTRRRVYLTHKDIVFVQKPQDLINIAMHKSKIWLDSIAADIWFSKVVNACRPLREKCRSLLVAISKTIKNKFGDKYWRTEGGRKMLIDELRLIGIKMPLFGSINNFVS